MSAAAVRLVGALDELIAAEAVALRAADVHSALAAQRRASPLIVALAEIARAEGIPASLSARLRAITERRQQNQICVAEMKARRQPQIERLRLTRRRLSGILPAYGKVKPRSRFAATV
jgi:hypothetical protein